MRLLRVLCLLMPVAAAAAELPRWELGAGAVGLRLPDYRGSDESRSYLYPLPYVVYRTQRLRLDRQGLRAVLFEGNRLELNFSAHATPPVDSDENAARRGMPHLDSTIEVGPQAQLTLLGRQGEAPRLDLRLPVRAVIATDLTYAKSAGTVAYPHLNLSLRPVLAGVPWNVSLQGGALFATRANHQYFYGVDARFATPQRPAYTAPGGYSGAVALASLSRRFERVWMGAFVRYDQLSGTAFEESPLVRRRSSFMAGFAMAYVFAVSDETVDVRD